MNFLGTVAPYVANCKTSINTYYCKMALPLFNSQKVRTLTLPFLSDELNLEEMGYPNDVMIEFKQVNLRKVDPEIYYFFHIFDSVDSVDFRRYMYSLGLDVKTSYNMVDINGRLIALITTSDELHCTDLFENMFLDKK